MSEANMRIEFEHENLDKRKISSWTPFFRQVLVALILWTSFFITGLGMGTATVAIPQLRAQANSTEVVSSEMASWIASIMGYSGTISIFIVIPIGHYLGRKCIMAVLAVSTLFSTALVYVSQEAIHLFVSQLLNGLSAAGQTSTHLLILSEYSSPKYRGVFLTVKSATFFWGMWVANAIGIFTHYKYIGVVGIVCSTYSFIISVIIPESPYWLAFKGKYNECATAHRWLKGMDDDAEEELRVLIKTQKDIAKNEYSSKSLQKHFCKIVTDIKQPYIFKPVLLSWLVICIYYLAGKLVCAVYAIEMMKKLTGNQTAVYNSVLILDGFTVLGMYIGCGLSKILKRRILLLSTSITGTITLFTMSIYLYLVKLYLLPENAYVIVPMLVVYSLSICCGPMILCSSISGELLPIRLRSLCSLFFSIFSLSLLSVVMKCSPYIFNSFGFHGAFLCFGSCSTIIIILLYKYLPETKDKTLQEIADMFKSEHQVEASQCKLLQTNGRCNNDEKCCN